MRSQSNALESSGCSLVPRQAREEIRSGGQIGQIGQIGHIINRNETIPVKVSLSNHTPSTDQAATLRLIAARTGTPGLRPERIIAVGSGKGGVGKSNIALNLAIELGTRGRAVRLFDADLGMANANILAGITPQLTLRNLLRDGKSLDEITTPGPAGIGMISGSSGISEMANLSNENRATLCRAFSNVEQAIEYMVVDAGAGISANVLTFMERADHAIIVVVPEPTSMADAYGMIKALVERRFPNRISVVVNRATSVREARMISDKMIGLAMEFLDQPVDALGFLLEDGAVGRAVKARAPFSLNDRSSKAARSVAMMADKIERGRSLGKTGKTMPADADFGVGALEAGTTAVRLRGWFERLFN